MTATAELYGPGSSEYVAATAPHNSSAQQHPAFVARPSSADEVAAVIAECAGRGLRVVPQATGHGAGEEIGAESVLLSTAALTSLRIGPATRVAVAGAGLTWGTVNGAAFEHGLLGLAGSAPSVSISGYTFGGGVGWLSRPHGLAASALRRVEYVDGSGALRTAAEDASDELDRDALWTFRGGGGVGVATELEFDLVPVPDLHAGYLLWPADRLDDVVPAWAAAMREVADDVATSISVLHTPPAPPFPPELRGVPVVHLAVAASLGAAGAAPLLDAVRAAAPPAVDTWGPSDAARLAGIHLDPPVAVSALGDARWLTDAAPGSAAGILSVALDGPPIVMLEIRSVGNEAVARPGAQTAVAGSYVTQAVAVYDPATGRTQIERALAGFREAAAPVDAGRSVGSWINGAASVPDALAPGVRDRVAAIADRVDPTGVIRRSRFVM